MQERPAGVDQAIFIYCAKGSGWCELAGRQHQVSASELLVIPPETPHVYGADEEQPWSIHWFHAKGTLLDSFFRALGASADRPVVRLGEDSQLLILFEEVLEALEHGYTTLQLICASMALTHLIAVMIRAHHRAPPTQPNAQQKVAHPIAYMKQHLNQALRLDALAALTNLSRSRYVELFKKQVGYAPINYLIRLRMHRACQLLDNTDLSVKEVAAELGYDDPLYFSRVFRAVNKRTPTDYRRTRKG